MATIDLTSRDRHPEWMDEPDLDQDLHHAALLGLARINRISRTARHLWRSIRRLVDASGLGKDAPLRILDIACGGGEVTVDLWRLATRGGRSVHVVGCDVSPVALAYAGERAASTDGGVTFLERDVVRDGVPTGFDVVCSSLFLHHLSNEEAEALLASAVRSGAGAIVVSDLIRSRWGYRLAAWGGRLLSRSPVVHKDGPLSVRAAFTCDEITALADRAGLGGATLRRQWPERFVLEWTRQGGGDAHQHAD